MRPPYHPAHIERVIQGRGMSGPRILSLFSGYGGLDLAILEVLGGDVVAHAEIEPAACRILEHRFPGVPNLGDVSKVDWSMVGPIDVVIGGFPCQDVSSAGKRAGLRPDNRSGLWSQMAYAISHLRPALVVIENVRGLLSAPAHSDLEPCPWCVGDDGGVSLRALGAVLGDLADLGYDASWVGLRAADVGAPHGRFRVFIVAWPTGDAEGIDLQGADLVAGGGGRAGGPGRGSDRGTASDASGHGRDQGTEAVRRWESVATRGGQEAAAAHAERDGRAGRREEATGAENPRRKGSRPAATRRSANAISHTQGDGRDEGRPEPARLVGGSDAAVGGAAAPTDTRLDRCGRLAAAHHEDGRDALRDVADGRPLADPDGYSVREQSVPVTWGGGAAVAGLAGADAAAGPQWGPYAAAVARWERLTRPAPPPTEPGAKGGHRLSPPFVEWMMGLPAGWVTAVPGVNRNAQLKALGNGVVPQQAAQALRLLLADMAAPPASPETEGAA